MFILCVYIHADKICARFVCERKTVDKKYNIHIWRLEDLLSIENGFV